MKLMRLFLITLLVSSLSGCVGLFIAGAATTVNIATDPRNTKEILDDNNLALEVNGLNNKAPFQQNVRISANSFRGSVLLIGQAKTEADLDQFVAKISALQGVKKLHNKVKIKTPLNLAEISNDSWITTKVKSALLTESKLNGVKVTVITEDSEVYLLGYLSREHADIATEVARHIKGVKQVVRAFEYAD